MAVRHYLLFTMFVSSMVQASWWWPWQDTVDAKEPLESIPEQSPIPPLPFMGLGDVEPQLTQNLLRTMNRQLNDFYDPHLEVLQQKKQLWASWYPEHGLSEGSAFWSDFDTQTVSDGSDAASAVRAALGYQRLLQNDWLVGFGVQAQEWHIHAQPIAVQLTRADIIAFMQQNNGAVQSYYAVALGQGWLHSGVQNKQASVYQLFSMGTEQAWQYSIQAVNISPLLGIQYQMSTPHHLDTQMAYRITAWGGIKCSWQDYRWVHKVIEFKATYGQDAFVLTDINASKEQDIKLTAALITLKQDKPFVHFGYTVGQYSQNFSQMVTLKVYYW